MKNLFPFILLFIFAYSCSPTVHRIDSYTNKYHLKKNNIELGMTKQTVISLLPNKNELKNKWNMETESYVENNKNYTIVYFRSSRIPDGQRTYNEFTPYFFENSNLVSIGWNSSILPEKIKLKKYNYKPYRYGCAENGSCFGDISSYTGRAKTVYVKGYYRKDGTYVRSHYRSKK